MWIIKPLAALLAVPAFLAVVLFAANAAQAADARLRADGTRLALTLADGRTLHSDRLVGAELQTAGGPLLRIDKVERHADPHGKPLWMHRLSVRDARGEWSELCAPHRDGTRFAMAVPGLEQADGTVADDAGSWAITCTAGARANACAPAIGHGSAASAPPSTPASACSAATTAAAARRSPRTAG